MCLTQLYDGRDMYRIYYIKNSYMFRHLSANRYIYPGADKSLARSWKETSYSDQDLQQYTKTYDVQTTAIYHKVLN